MYSMHTSKELYILYRYEYNTTLYNMMMYMYVYDTLSFVSLCTHNEKCSYDPEIPLV